MKSFKELKHNLKIDVSDKTLIKVALIGDTATQLLATAIKGEGVERGFNINLFEAEYNQVERQILDPTSDYYAFGAEYTVIFQSTHKLLEKYSLLPSADWNKLANERMAFVRTLCESVQGKVIYCNYPEIDDTVFGSYANKVSGSFTYQVRKLNLELMNLAQEYPNCRPAE